MNHSSDRLRQSLGAWEAGLAGEPARQQQTLESPPRRTVLVVNDQACQLRYTSEVLKTSGYNVLSYSSAKLALEGLSKSGPVDLIVTDLNMPEVSGWVFCEALRSQEFRAHNATPVLVISATFSGLDSDTVCLELGVNDFLPMPYTVEQLRRKAASLIEGHNPKPRLNALLLGFDSNGPEAQAFSLLDYEVICCQTIQEAAELKRTTSVQVAVARGHLSQAEFTLFFTFNTPLVAKLWVYGQVTSDAAVRANQLEVDLVTYKCKPELLVELCERGRQEGALTRTRDLLEQRTLQLLSSEATYRSLFQSIPDLVFLADESGIVQNVNEAGTLMLGRPADEVVGRHLVDFTLEEYSTQSLEMLQETLAYGYVQYEMTFRTAVGESIMEVHQRKIVRGESVSVLAIARDITERRHCQEAVKMSDTRYRILAENTYDWEFWVSPMGHFLFSSPACEKVTGYPPRDFEDDSQSLFDLVHPDDKKMVEKNWPTDAWENGRDFVFRIFRADGQIRWIHHISQSIYDSYGNFIGSRGSHRDITEKRKGEEERARLVAAVEQVTEAIVITDVMGNVAYANQSYLESKGLKWPDVVGFKPKILSSDENAELALEIAASLRDFKNWCGSYQLREGSRSEHFEATVSLVRDAQSKPSHYIWVERNVTRERHLQEQLLQSQKMEAVGTLAGGIAHDFNNLLGGILGYAGLLKVQAQNNGEILHAAEVIERTARRAADLTQQLLGFARQGKHQNVNLNLHQCICDCLQLLNRTFDKQIQITTDFCAGDVQIMGDPTQLESVLLNLSINARDAMQNAGRLTFRTRISEEAIQQPGAPEIEAVAGPVVILEIIDSGQGIPLDLQNRIFEPFFTTKESGKGTGMGLAMVYGIVRNHGGSIRVNSKLGVGTTFIITLPLVVDCVPREPESRPMAPIKGSGRVLVVDDEDFLRDIASRLLEHLGYEVATVADGVEACEYYSRNYQDVDLVIIDMIMPKMAGGECFRNLKQCNPGVRAILSTGYSLNETAQALLDEGMVGFVQKPYQLSQLSEAVARALSASIRN